MSCPSIRFLLEIFSPPFILQPIFLVSISGKWKAPSPSSSPSSAAAAARWSAVDVTSFCRRPFRSTAPALHSSHSKAFLLLSGRFPENCYLFPSSFNSSICSNSRIQQMRILNDIYLVYEARPAQTENFFPHLDLQIKTFQVFQR